MTPAQPIVTSCILARIHSSPCSVFRQAQIVWFATEFYQLQGGSFVIANPTGSENLIAGFVKYIVVSLFISDEQWPGDQERKPEVGISADSEI